MDNLKFIKTFGLILLCIGFIIAISGFIYVSNYQIVNMYYAGIMFGSSIGFSLSGALLRLYSATNS